jgi:hypothetical protein
MVPAVAVAFAFGPAKSSLQERLDRHFFRSRALLRSRLAGFADSITPFDRESEIWRAAWDSGWKYVDPRWAAVVSDRDDGRREEITAGEIPDDTAREGLRLPLEGREGALGFCLLGPKRGGDLYSREELSFVRAIAAQSALAPHLPPSPPSPQCHPCRRGPSPFPDLEGGGQEPVEGG